MRYAVVRDFRISEFIEIDDDDALIEISRTAQIVLPVDHLFPQPAVGWVFNGSGFEPQDASELAMRVKLYRFMTQDERSIFKDHAIPPFGWNYKTGLTQRLHFKDDNVYGRIRSREYFAEKQLQQDGTVDLSDLVMREDYEYDYSGFGDVIERRIWITWYCEGGQPHPDRKVHTKSYLINLNELLEEAVSVRRAFISNLKIVLRQFAVPSVIENDQVPQEILDMMGGNIVTAAELVAIQMIERHEVAMASFINTSSPTLMLAIMSDNESPWLNNEFFGTTFRMYIVSEINNFLLGLGKI